MADMRRARERWKRDEPCWHFVLSTFWQYDYEHMVRLLASCDSLDEAVERAERERDGMVAT